MSSFRQPGNNILVTAPYDRASAGLPLRVGGIFGSTTAPVLSGSQVVIETDGVHELPKVSAEEWASAGLPIYFVDSTKLLTTSHNSGANRLVGYSAAPAANPSSLGRVKLLGFALDESGAAAA